VVVETLVEKSVNLAELWIRAHLAEFGIVAPVGNPA
jgi:hypothetical protein